MNTLHSRPASHRPVTSYNDASPSSSCLSDDGADHNSSSSRATTTVVSRRFRPTGARRLLSSNNLRVPILGDNPYGSFALTLLQPSSAAVSPASRSHPTKRRTVWATAGASKLSSPSLRLSSLPWVAPPILLLLLLRLLLSSCSAAPSEPSFTGWLEARLQAAPCWYD